MIAFKAFLTVGILVCNAQCDPRDWFDNGNHRWHHRRGDFFSSASSPLPGGTDYQTTNQPMNSTNATLCLSDLAIAAIITLIIIVLIGALLIGYVCARLQMWRKQVVDAKKMLEAENQLNHHLEMSTSHKIDDNFNSNLYTQMNSESAKKYEN